MELIADKLQTNTQNKVLSETYSPSTNFFNSDIILQHYLKNNLSNDGLAYMWSKYDKMGELAANGMDALSLLADKNFPQLVKRNKWGDTINEIRFHPAYWQLMKIAVASEMMKVKWKPDLRKRFPNELHSLSFGASYLYAMSELGQYCPLCMTDGVARLIDKFCKEEDKNRLLPHIYTDDLEQLYTGAMYLTEKSGGSDVGANLTEARHIKDDLYELKGEKWFCSNANADIIFALARTNEEISGTRGLSIFLVEKYLPDGAKNSIDIVRIKDKLGVRSMASAECMLNSTIGKLVGDEFSGFKIMTEMINLSRLYNSVAALSGSRRALIEAYQFLNHRMSFGKKAINHALIKDKLWELGSLHVANFYLTWRAITALDKADNGDEKELQLARLITPMVKKWSAEKSVYITRESMELMGGMGYIEDTVMPKLMRDVMVLPIWEGAGNVMILDMLRAYMKTDAYHLICDEIINASVLWEHGDLIKKQIEIIGEKLQEFNNLAADEVEIKAKYIFAKLTTLYQVALIIQARDEKSEQWINPALKYFYRQLSEQSKVMVLTEEISSLIAWDC